MSNIKLFESKKIRSHWDAEAEQWYFSVVDIIEALTGTDRPRKYWNDLKTKLNKEGSQLSEKIGQLKMKWFVSLIEYIKGIENASTRIQFSE